MEMTAAIQFLIRWWALVGWGLGVIIDIHPPSSALGSQYKLRFADASYTDELKKIFPLQHEFRVGALVFFLFFGRRRSRS